MRTCRVPSARDTCMVQNDAVRKTDTLPASSLSCLAFLERQRHRLNGTTRHLEFAEGNVNHGKCIPMSRWSSVRLRPALGGGMKRNLHQAAGLHHAAGGHGEALKLRGRDQVEAWGTKTQRFFVHKDLNVLKDITARRLCISSFLPDTELCADRQSHQRPTPWTHTAGSHQIKDNRRILFVTDYITNLFNHFYVSVH